MTLLSLPAPAPLSAADSDAYAALSTDAVFLPADVRWLELIGEKAPDALNGLITNDVTTLGEGMVMRAVALTPKGKVLADLLVWRQGTSSLALITDPLSAEAFTAMARKYVNPRLAALRDQTASHGAWWLLGVRASALTSEVGWPSGVTVVPCPPLGAVPRLLLRAAQGDAAALTSWLETRAVAGAAALLDLLRVEAGDPQFGIDMDDGTIPQEANLDTLDAISFTKGCYTGQETVARVHFRGHVNRHLRGLCADAPIPGGSLVADAEGKGVGDVRSTAMSPRHGAIALGMIRREVPLGSLVQIQREGAAPVVARVVALPFLVANRG